MAMLAEFGVLAHAVSKVRTAAAATTPRIFMFQPAFIID
jgi:hypothetical protein